ncbi:MAG TPA: hypothetical protein VG838_16385 [Opitutaceae bacterium]|nr:hypothetical protein [Opitutaceae bacterium]
MSTEHRSLMMRTNRLLGAALVEHNLVKMEDLEKANERLLEVMALNQPRQSTLLGILAYEMKVVREDDVLQHIVESEGAGLVDLRNYDTSDEIKKNLDAGACWATWSVPFDREEDFYFVATAYYLSPAVRTFWEKQFGAQIVWYGTTLDVIADYLEKLEAEQANNPAAAAGGTRSPFSAPGSKPPFPATKAPAPAAPSAAPAPAARSA